MNFHVILMMYKAPRVMCIILPLEHKNTCGYAPYLNVNLRIFQFFILQLLINVTLIHHDWFSEICFLHDDVRNPSYLHDSV